MQISIIDGIYTDAQSDYRVDYPRNRVPVFQPQGTSNGYLRPSEGIIQVAETVGRDRGGINWNDALYRVFGSFLYRVDASGALISIGFVDDDLQNVVMDYSFDVLAICSANKLYYFNGDILTRNTDADLGVVKDMIWIDGYFFTTDGENLITTQLNDINAVNPIKYGSSEVDPDPVVAVKKVRNEAYAVNRYSIEVFKNVGGTNVFPFQRINGGQITRGAIGRDAVVVFEDSLAFVGGRLNEQVAVWVGVNGVVNKISTREIDQVINSYSISALQNIKCETRRYNDHVFMYIHFTDQTLVYDFETSKKLQKPIWHILTSGTAEKGAYNARNIVFCYNRWYCGHATDNKLGYLTDTTQEQYGEKVTWDFSTQFIYNASKGAIVNSLELVALTGRTEFGKDPQIFTQYSYDGIEFSQRKYISAGKTGQRQKRIVWRKQGKMQSQRIQKFSGDSDAFLSFSRLEAELEPLAW